MTRIIGWFTWRSHLAAVFIGAAFTIASVSPIHAIIIRHDVDDALYVQDGNAYPAVFEVFDRRGGVATLIAPQWALTVAHVAQSIPQGHRVTIAGESYAVAQVILHPGWETALVDISLVRLDRPVEGVNPIAPYEGDDEAGQVVTFVGRGDTGTGLTGPVSQDHKPWVELIAFSIF